jgi:hypothetical protein
MSGTKWLDRAFGIYLHKNKQIHQNYHFVVMLSQMLVHVLAHQRHNQEAHTILTSYLYVGVRYRKIMEYLVK